MIVGYARTSTLEQEAGFEAQERNLFAAGANVVFKEQISSVAKRPELEKCLDSLADGDVLMVTKPDRLARSTTDLLRIVGELTDKGVGLILLSMGGERLDTRNPTSKLMLTVLAGVATWEREIMLERQRDGIAKAKADGKYKGRKPYINSESVKALRLEGKKATEIAKALGISRDSVYRLLED